MKIVIILVLSLLSSHIDKYAQAEEIAAFKTDAKSGIIYPVNKNGQRITIPVPKTPTPAELNKNSSNFDYKVISATSVVK